ncbi:interleukin-9 [Sorex fumeus]|uniref:interleukin-9 n=1 Tax=Sorex fumeus TaxID=62283 RepID=UPI0024ACC2EA|nr:interleukin-9 [Sorex fumeus]
MALDLRPLQAKFQPWVKMFLVLASALLLCSVATEGCRTSSGIRDVQFLIRQKQGTDCLCLPIPSDNCTTPCFQEGLSQMINSTAEEKLLLSFYRLKKSIEHLKDRKCSFFSCEQPCNRTTTGNTLTFLESLLETFQKQTMRSRI